MSDLFVQLSAPNGCTWLQPTGLFINNEWVKSSNGHKIASINPATSEEIISVYGATAEDVDKAVKAARAALTDPTWRDLSGLERGKLMSRLAKLIEDNRETLATIDTIDNGKPYTVALNEDLTETAETIRYYSGFADKVFGQVIPTNADKFAYTVREPVGVCGQIIPWNYPLAMAAWKLGPALACGNTVVLKPAEQTPLSALFLANLIVEAGFPPGVVNIVNGYGSIAGAALASHMEVDKIAFTGSTETARHIMKMASGNLKNITMETGGKSPLIVFNDADLTEAVKWAHWGIMSNQGQAQVKNVSKVGDPFDASTFQGPQVTRAQYDRVMSYVRMGQAEKATLLCGGKPVKDIGNGKGFYIEPTVFTDVSPEMRIYREEIFGPVAVIARFATDEEAIRMANDSTYGLGGAIFTTNLTRAHQVAGRVEAGTVWINFSNVGDWRVPFGGVKQSGIGRELGQAGLDEYTNIKAVHVNVQSKL
ncbi:aldehyde dehydrogenase [Aspergillus saccharolyticus JOP 1030-1]|uniref:aldehyde dehydrogenase (NAD(+)) n=1 Tax=Aspergillus saccharolyticus JOP 1030-1 TaxID=1450539 RepID=A0A319A457_9EURO|nr:aldehyde dehydrogenase [Aspergillus saccharolyticus JOP 1030-1]PYH46908.1 aldehyde dehydrogenase [Aspergillus saccharolyticus JOP 1030-1]